jgi:hypothetical protein
MKQVKLNQGDAYITSWIDSYGAKLNYTMEVDGYEGRWTVIEVYDYDLPKDALKEHQKNTRNIFGSIL